MTQDAGITVKEQGVWLQVNVGTSDAPKIMRLKVVPADFEEIQRINSKIVEAGKPIKGNKDGTFDGELFAKEVTGGIAKFIVDWNLHDENGKIECNEENKRKQLGRFLIAFATVEADVVPGETIDTSKPADRPTVLTLILKFIGDYSNFLEA